MLTVHHLEESRSHRILWLLEELELDYEIERYRRDPETKLAPDSLSRVHPLGKAPVLTDGDKTIAESAAIIEYVIDEYGDGRLRPEAGTEAHRRYRYWMHYAEASVMPNLLLRIVFEKIPEQLPWPVSSAAGVLSGRVEEEFIAPRIRTHLDFWEAELAERKFFADDEFTACDIQMSVAVKGAAKSVEESEYPRVHEWIDRVCGREAHERAVERGGGTPY